MPRENIKELRVYIRAETYAKLVAQSEQSGVPIRYLIQNALEKHTIEGRDYLLHQSARYAYIGASMALQIATKLLSPEDLRNRLERVSGSFTATFGSTPPIPDEVRARIETAPNGFVLEFARLLEAYVNADEAA
ncbi:hypothetical protein [Asticcacaulis sp. W401b]|uniref:hypothetical protein n=1 Tax=Asticcacaulis sp. W401b TaxID=3388666 RepID=UPI003970B21B